MGATSPGDRRRSGVKIERLLTPKGQEFDQLFRIYREAIPASERKSRQTLAAMTKQENYRVLLAKVGNDLVGFSINFVPERPTFVLLEYMAVDERERGKGLGTAVFRETVRMLRDELDSVPVLLEVDSDREPSKDYAKRVKRMHFYRRNGCRRVANLHYILPLKVNAAPPAMDMLIFDGLQSCAVAKDELAGWLQAIYVEVYGRSPDDPRIETMLHSLPDCIETD